MELPLTLLPKARHQWQKGPRCLGSGFWLRHPVVLLLMFSLISGIFLCAQQTTAKADPPNLMARTNLFGDWGGVRTNLSEKHGVSFDFHYIGDFLADPSAPSGVVTRATDWSRLRGTVDVDFGKLTGVTGLSFHATGVWQGGTYISGVFGGIADASGIESFHGFRLDSAWLQQALFNNHLFLKAGQFAGLDFYGVQEYGGAHIAADLDYGLTRPLINTYEQFDPFSSPAAELRVEPTKNVTFKMMVESGNVHLGSPGSPASSYSGVYTPIQGHAVLLDEVSYHFTGGSAGAKSYPGIYKFGSSYNGGTSEFKTFSGAPTSEYAIYFQGNQAVYRVKPGSNQGLDLEFGIAHNPSNVQGAVFHVNQVITAGAVYHGLVPRRSKDTLGFGIVRTTVPGTYVTANPGTISGSESIYEVAYTAALTRWMNWQPVLQIWNNVGAINSGNPGHGNAVVAGFRTFIDF
jgi:porin